MTEERISNVDSSRMGKAVEHLVAAACILQSRALLNVSTSLVDDEGIELVFHRKDATATLAVQVKARMSDSRPLQRLGRFQAFVRSQTLRPRPGLYLMFVLADVHRGDVRLCWLVPSQEFITRARQDRLGRFVFRASAKPQANDQWIRFVTSGLKWRLLCSRHCRRRSRRPAETQRPRRLSWRSCKLGSSAGDLDRAPGESSSWDPSPCRTGARTQGARSAPEQPDGAVLLGPQTRRRPRRLHRGSRAIPHGI